MDNARRVTVSLALIVLVCFSLPWVQLSCGGAKSANTGIDLARGGDGALWLIPSLMLVVIALGLMRALRTASRVFGLTSLLSGLVSAYLMNHERLKFEDTSGLIAVRLTGWFWLGLGSSIAVAAFGASGILRRSRSP